MPLQNRVAPDGSLHAVAARGTMMGNRGGKFHRDDKTLSQRRWASQHWICCELKWKDAHHEPMGQGYTSLFFLDEVTALAAGHRPCFFCRREEAQAFLGGETVGVFDARLHGERIGPRDLISRFATASPEEKRLFRIVPSPLGKVDRATRETDEVPSVTAYRDGSMFTDGSSFFALRRNKLLRWSFAGYIAAIPFTPLKPLTPPSITAILAKGFQPRWHASAFQWDD
jgi:hypothetical protein